MPSYSFQCPGCGVFTVWYASMQGNRQETNCPTCQQSARRVFTPPITFHMDSKVKQRIERGMEPRLVNRKDMPKKASRKPAVSRPWQAGH